MSQHVQSHERRSPGPGGRPGFSLIELVLVVWVLAVLALIAVPTFGTARDNTRARYSAGCVAQEIRQTGQLAFAHGRKYTLDAATRTDELVQTPQGLTATSVLDLQEPSFRSVLIPNTTVPYVNALTFDASGDATTAVSWKVVSGNSVVTVIQPVGVVSPTTSGVSRTTAADLTKYKARTLSSL